MTIPKAITALAISVVTLALFGAARMSDTTQPDSVVKPAWTGPVITVSGSGEVERKPDYAVVVVGMQVRETSAAAASEAVGNAMLKIRKALDELNFPNMRLQTSGVSLNPAYSWQNDRGDQRQTLIGYDASSTLRVRLEDPTKIGAVIDAAVRAGANRIHGISFELKEALAARQEAITMAAQAARQKAETLAAALGLRITSVLTATTSSDTPPWQPLAANRAQFDAAAAGLGDVIEPGMVTVRAEATVTFAAVERE